MPAHAFGIQLVYTAAGRAGAGGGGARRRRGGDARGYHPGVSSPACGLNFLWMIGGHREGVDRQFGVVNVQPEYAASGSGLDPGRAQVSGGPADARPLRVPDRLVPSRWPGPRRPPPPRGPGSAETRFTR